MSLDAEEFEAYIHGADVERKPSPRRENKQHGWAEGGEGVPAMDLHELGPQQPDIAADTAADAVLLAQLSALFSSIDTNHDGAVSRAELLLALRRDGALAEKLQLPAHTKGRKGRARFGRVFEAIDADRSDELSLEEFVAFFQQQQQQEQEEQPEQQSEHELPARAIDGVQATPSAVGHEACPQAPASSAEATAAQPHHDYGEAIHVAATAPTKTLTPHGGHSHSDAESSSQQSSSSLGEENFSDDDDGSGAAVNVAAVASVLAPLAPLAPPADRPAAASARLTDSEESSSGDEAPAAALHVPAAVPAGELDHSGSVESSSDDDEGPMPPAAAPPPAAAAAPAATPATAAASARAATTAAPAPDSGAPSSSEEESSSSDDDGSDDEGDGPGAPAPATSLADRVAKAKAKLAADRRAKTADLR